MMNLRVDNMDVRLKWCQSNKNQNWDLIIFSNEIVFSDLRKSKKNLTQITQFIELQKLEKKNIGSMHRQQY